MALIKMKPTSPGARFVVKIDRSHLHKGGPLASLTTKKNRRARAITPAGRPPGTSRRPQAALRLVDFKRDKDGIPGVVERLEYDPNRTSHLALILYKDGERRYILAAKGCRPATKCAPAPMLRSSRATRSPSGTFPSAARCTTSN